MDKLQTINYFIDRNILVSPDFLEKEIDVDDFFDKVVDLDSKPLVFNQDILNAINVNNKLPSINWIEFEKAKVNVELGGEDIVYDTFMGIINYNVNLEVKQKVDITVKEIKKDVPIDIQVSNDECEGSVVVLQNYQEEIKKKEVRDFVEHFKGRYNSIKKILLSRSELQDSVSISRLSSRKEGDKCALIGIIVDIRKTKNGNILARIEDLTGRVNILFSKNKGEVFSIADTLVLDEVIGLTGNLGNKIVFANSLILPDIPISHELKKSSEEGYAAFIGDIHLGTNLFQADDFMKFIKWLRGEHGTDKQKEIVSKIRYLFIVGDLVEGVGIYPGQENELTIKDIKLQYDELARYLKMIPSRIKIIACGGNHDAMRIAEPQPVFDKKYASSLYELPNFLAVSNPTIVNIHSSESFPGFDVLLYHGFSFPYYADNVQEIRSAGGLDRIDMIMKFLLQRRHLCPTHTANLYVPDSRGDPMVIEKVPDFFVTGHIHKVTVSNYRNITMINSSCWDTQSSEQERRGIVPDTAKVPIVNLKTRQVKIMNFFGGVNERNE